MRFTARTVLVKFLPTDRCSPAVDTVALKPL